MKNRAIELSQAILWGATASKETQDLLAMEMVANGYRLTETGLRCFLAACDFPSDVEAYYTMVGLQIIDKEPEDNEIGGAQKESEI